MKNNSVILQVDSEYFDVNHGGKKPLKRPMTYEKCPKCGQSLTVCNSWDYNFYCDCLPGVNYYCECGWNHITIIISQKEGKMCIVYHKFMI